ncbi:hypothetical protein SAMN04489844_1467 [Nocardioides exalbidus]|uniref:Uncharacterized protein n=1 Tax=Nocardioides exalbidus TaxID=402596 RepID=A0A1H4NVY6_9ACTN|nr:hypothetical protein SAMN04489844_1467 [Nocardioides exalbidus]
MDATIGSKSSADRLPSSGSEPFEACPDGGRCWHDCPLVEGAPEGKGMPCWRVKYAAPLSTHGSDWTPEEKAAHRGLPGPMTEVTTTDL